MFLAVACSMGSTSTSSSKSSGYVSHTEEYEVLLSIMNLWKGLGTWISNNAIALNIGFHHGELISLWKTLQLMSVPWFQCIIVYVHKFPANMETPFETPLYFCM